MDPRSQSDSDGGGGHHGRTPPSNGSPAAMPDDEGRPQPGPAPGSEGPADGGLGNGQLHVLSLEQIRIMGSSNEYTEGPTVAQRSPAALHGHQKSDSLTSSGSRRGGQHETPEERPNNLRNLHSLTPPSTGSEDSQSAVRMGYRLLSSPPGTEHIIRLQPKSCQPHSEELKPLNEQPRAAEASKDGGAHSDRCEECGRCRCQACRRPRELPSCLLCNGRCVCSAPHAVEYCTCVCCVKGLFYHCSSDEEDTCSDKPFSCTQSHRCARWATVALLAPLLPCLLCYLPAKGCVVACESCYNRAAQPGCRCRNSKPGHREDGGKLT